jgi:mono/diheme cytochrome c family protein
MRLIFMTIAGHRHLAVLLVGMPLVAVVVLLCEQAAECSAPGLTVILDERTPAEATSDKVKKGAIGSPIQLFRASCLECHDNDGRGEIVRDNLPTIPDFTDAKWHASRSDADLSRSILEGKGKSMPRMKKKLGSIDVKQMVSFVREFKGGKQVVDEEPEAPAAPEHSNAGPTSTTLRSQSLERSPAIQKDQNHREGSQLFQRFCARCHGSDGLGTTLRDQTPSIPDFTSQVWQQRRSAPELTIAILEGKGTVMPAFRGKLNEVQIRDLVTYLRAFAPQSASASVGPEADFKRRFGQLTQELDDLKKQYQDLSKE